MSRSRSLVLCSGGIKSLFLASMAAKDGPIELLFIDHGQDNLQQEKAAVERCALTFAKERHYETQYHLTPLSKVNPLIAIIEMLCLAIPVAQKLNCDTVYHGLSKDCWQEIPELATQPIMEGFLTVLQSLFLIVQPAYDIDGQYLGQPLIELPLYKLTKAQIIHLGSDWNIDWSMPFSCERKSHLHCGDCLKCKQRRWAYKQLNWDDPIRYLKGIYNVPTSH